MSKALAGKVALVTGGSRGLGASTVRLLLSSLSIQRIGHPDEIAAAIGFLAGPTATYVTGAVLDAHGGYNA